MGGRRGVGCWVLGVLNLLYVKHSLMDKNLFNYLKLQDLICVNIIVWKYGMHNFWTNLSPPNYSVFFKGLCVSENLLKPYLWIECINLNKVTILYHSWIIEIIIAFKPVFQHGFEF